LAPDQIEKELHVGHPPFVAGRIRGRLFQDGFVASGKRFRPARIRIYSMTKPESAGNVSQHRRGFFMLEAIVLLLALASCALILVSFWGLDLLRMHFRRADRSD